MKMHICTEQPCPLQEQEIAKTFELGFTTNYINMPEQITITKAWVERLIDLVDKIDKADNDQRDTFAYLSGYVHSLDHLVDSEVDN